MKNGGANLDSIQETLNELVTKVDTNVKTLSDLEGCIVNNTATCQEALRSVKEVTEANKALKAELDQVKLEKAQLASQQKELHEKLIKLESHSRRDNLLFEGVSESDPDDVHKKLKSIFKDKLKINNPDDIKIVREQSLGRKYTGPGNTPRPIIVNCHWFGDRMAIWKAKTNLQASTVYISEDYPKEINDRRRILKPIMMKAKQEKHAAFLNVDKLFIDGKQYSVDNIYTIPAALHPSVIATPQVGDNIRAFFGGQSPCSNFQLAKFKVG
jgi:hypothetical protein